MVLSVLGKVQHHNGWSVVEGGALCPTTWSRKPSLQNSMNLGGASSPGISSEEVGSQGEDAKVLVIKLCLTL